MFRNGRQGRIFLSKGERWWRRTATFLFRKLWPQWFCVLSSVRGWQTALVLPLTHRDEWLDLARHSAVEHAGRGVLGALFGSGEGTLYTVSGKDSGAIPPCSRSSILQPEIPFAVKRSCCKYVVSRVLLYSRHPESRDMKFSAGWPTLLLVADITHVSFP